MAEFLYTNEAGNKTVSRVQSMKKRIPKYLQIDGELYWRDFAAEQSGGGGHKSSCWPMKPSMFKGCLPFQAKEKQAADTALGVPTEWKPIDKYTSGPVWTSQKHQDDWIKAHNQARYGRRD